MVKPVSEKPGDRSDSKYKGVRKRKWGKWVSEIRLPNSRERIWLGSYDSAEKAARAFDAALFCLRGKTAKFNFPNNPPEIAGGRSLSPPEIQAAAAKFANSEATAMQSDQFSTDQSLSVSELHVESPCTSVVSDGTVQLDSCELPWDGSFLDMPGNMVGPGSYAADYGIFPGFDDLINDFSGASMAPNLDYGDENVDSLTIAAQDSFLWNF
ncbi:hypothetical protein Tsubulata_029806 [Turnera subulata]|uniref:AP2/ERF domain-containing protein n=1 Tax=Turnera subulata TaxID=218843 RepID=A0A9Q0FAC3_9ROSI|nr:hypothetical protein Tsubulata_029806 [Turnera subulata]